MRSAARGSGSCPRSGGAEISLRAATRKCTRCSRFFIVPCLLHTHIKEKPIVPSCNRARPCLHVSTHFSHKHVRNSGRSRGQAASFILLPPLLLLLPFKRVSRKPAIHQWRDGKFYHMITGGNSHSCTPCLRGHFFGELAQFLGGAWRLPGARPHSASSVRASTSARAAAIHLSKHDQRLSGAV